MSPPTADDPLALTECADGVRRLARRLVAEDRVDDLVQEAMLVLLTGSARVRRGVGAWLAGVTRNLARRSRRTELRRAAREAGAARPDRGPSTAEVVARLEERRRVLALVRELGEPYRTAVWLRYFEDLPPREISARLGVPVETVKSRIKRGLACLRSRLDLAHGGRRRAWLGVLLPLGLPTPRLFLPFAGGVAVKKTVTAIALFLLLLLLGGGAWITFGGFERPAPEPEPVVEPLPEPVAAAPLEGAAETADEAAGETAKVETPEAPEVPVAAVPPAETTVRIEDPEDASIPAAVGRNPRVPPEPKPGSTRFGGGGGFGPTGGWSKFPPPRLSGAARITVTVRDEDGQPIPGADVYLGPPDTAGQSPVSFGHLKKIGRTGADGVLVRENLPEGRAAVAANLDGLMNRPRGLDATSAKKTVLRPHGLPPVELTLPIKLAEMGDLRGVVRGPDGKPVRSAEVSTGFKRVYANAAGEFEILHLAAGSHRLTVRRTGYEVALPEVTVTAGGATRVEVDLEYRDAGSIVLSGSVVGPEGEPVPEATVYVLASVGRGRGTIRSARTDASGRFSMAALPDRLSETKVRLQADARGYSAGNVVFEAGLTGGSVEIRLPERLVMLKLKVVDSADGTPLDRFRMEARRPEDARARTVSTYNEEETFDFWLPAGTYDLLVEAPDHEPERTKLTLSPPGGEVSHTAKLRPSGPPSVEVTVTLALLSQAGDPVTKARVEIVSERTGEATAALETTRDDGVFSLPVPSGEWLLRVRAEGYETFEERIELDPAVKKVSKEVRLTRE